MFVYALPLLVSSIVGWTEPYKPASNPEDLRAAIAQHQKTGKEVFLQGTVLTIVTKSVAPKVQFSSPIRAKLSKVEGTDYWAAQLEGKNWNQAFFSYSIQDGSDRSKIRLKDWFGPQAPKPHRQVSKVQGNLETFELEMGASGMKRKVLVYLPPNAPKGVPVVYLTDGESARSYAPAVEAAIQDGQIRPIALVGVFSGPYQGKFEDGYDVDLDLRATEYLHVLGKPDFERHLNFFSVQVPAWAEQKFGVSNRRADRILHGFSNGGAFVVVASILAPEVFGHVLPYSVAATDTAAGLQKLFGAQQLPDYYFASGTMEPFIENSYRMAKLFQGNRAKVVQRNYFEAGHDFLLWSLAFVNHLKQIVPKT
jgi:enterochelin esterase-like enzyme